MRRNRGSESSGESDEDELLDGTLGGGAECSSELNALAESEKKNSRLCRNLTIAAIPIAAILIFMSRPIIGFLSREICYYVQGEAPTLTWYNPISWGNRYLHKGISLYKCEWMGHWGFNWLSVMQWISEKGTSIFTSLGVVGGSYATWKSVTAWFKKKTMSEDDKDRLRELAQHIHIRETEGEAPNIVSFTNTLRFSPLLSRDGFDADASIPAPDPSASGRKMPSTLQSSRH